MSVTIIDSLKVADFVALKARFDAHASARAEAGMGANDYQKVYYPNNAVAIATAPSKEVFAALSIVGGSTRDPPGRVI